MAKAKRRIRHKVRQRDAALSRAQIVDAAIDLLDREGEQGLTFKTLAERLATGAGAIYGHIANKDDLMAAACDAIIGQVQAARATGLGPQDSIREYALGIFDAIRERPWLGAALVRLPGELPLIRVLDAVGQDIRALGVPTDKQWASTMAVFNYIVGVGGQHAANAQLARSRQWDRSEVLSSLARCWAQLSPQDYPFAQSIASEFRVHDDRADFLTGVDLIVTGIRASTVSALRDGNASGKSRARASRSKQPL